MLNDEIMEAQLTDNLQIIKKEKSLLQIANEAEKMIDAVKKIKEVALKLTNADDWVDENDKPYLQASGSEKIAGPFGISWTFLNDPTPEVEDDGHFTYCYKGRFSMGGRTIDVDGSRSSKDPFFNKYDYVDKLGPDGNPEKYPDGNIKKNKIQKPISAIDKRDVKMAAMTNLLGNGITRILGIRNLTWEDLDKFAKIKKEQVRGVKYGKGGNKPDLKEPQKRETPAPVKTETGNPKIKTQVMDVSLKAGKKDGKPWTKYTITGLNQDGNEIAFGTFSETFGSIATKERGSGVYVEIEYVTGAYGNDIKNLQLVEERQPGEEG